MSRRMKTILIVIAAIAMVICVFCCIYIFQHIRGMMLNDRVNQMALSDAPRLEMAEPAETDGSGMTAAEAAAAAAAAQAAEEEAEETVPAVVNFDALEEINDEVYAWIQIPGTNISYPVAQSGSNDLFYNNHAVDKSYFTGGCIYSQSYNSKSFEDSVTVLYGHNRKDQTYFAQLHNFADADFFEENREIVIYTRDTMYRYTVFAAYPHTSEHLLLCYDFDDEEQFSAYFDGLSDTVINANYAREDFPAFGDKVLTLSTCYRLSRSQRYLVQGVLTETRPVAEWSEQQ